MKKYLIGLFAVVLAVGFTAFTNPDIFEGKRVIKYLEYKGPAFDKFLVTSYNLLTSKPAQCTAAIQICWFSIDDVNNDGISQAEFNARVAALDAVAQGPGVFPLDNETENNSTIEKRQ